MGNMKDKVVLAAGGASGMGAGIVSVLLQQGATVIVPVASARQAELLHSRAGHSERLIVYLTDFSDYGKAEGLMDDIFSEYHRIDLVVAALESACALTPLLDIDILEWQKNMDRLLTGSFILDRLCLPLLSRGTGVFISVCRHAAEAEPESPMARILQAAGEELSRTFAREAGPKGIRCYKILLDEQTTGSMVAGAESGTYLVPPAQAGPAVIQLFGQKEEEPRLPGTQQMLHR